jgi:hypothetical protein
LEIPFLAKLDEIIVGYWRTEDFLERSEIKVRRFAFSLDRKYVLRPLAIAQLWFSGLFEGNFPGLLVTSISTINFHKVDDLCFQQSISNETSHFTRVVAQLDNIVK